jgi:hypothetical protein
VAAHAKVCVGALPDDEVIRDTCLRSNFNQ